ncbi:ATPase [Candidatus Peregrinibacteria bacterium]|nr:MAG: ATPase [Candidatus Peregrinibacteria bacterium]
MIKRIITNQVVTSLQNFPVVGLLGPRQVGKTTLAKSIAKDFQKSLYLDLESPSDREKLSDPEFYLQQHEDSLVIIDEIQREPELFLVLRSLVDKNRISGRFLLLGSASPDLIRHSSESLAGRIVYHELHPFLMQEVDFSSDDKKLWVQGGFPESFLSEKDKSFQWRQAYLRTFLERDLPQLDIKTPSRQLYRFLVMIAHSHGQILNMSKLASALDVSVPTVKRYLDILEETYIIRRIHPYFYNVKKRMIKSPKVYIRDSGLLHYLLNIHNFESLYSHPVFGNSWEGFVLEQIMGMLPVNYEIYYYRTVAGAEVDVLIVDADQNISLVEIKHSLSPKLSKGFFTTMQDLGNTKGFVIYPGSEKYYIKDNVQALPVENLHQLFVASKKI